MSCNHRARLARWLMEWHIDRTLRTPAPRGHSSIPLQTATASIIEPSGCRAGDVRLLFPSHTADAPRGLLYVAILDSTPQRLFRICPFSRFSEPATTGEWLTRCTAPALRVLCLWNTRTVPEPVVLRSWPAGQLTPRQLASALEVQRYLSTGALPRHARVDDLGPPLLHPADPRWAYEVEAAAEMDAAMEALSTRFYWTDSRRLTADARPLDKAAEPPPAYSCD